MKWCLVLYRILPVCDASHFTDVASHVRKLREVVHQRHTHKRSIWNDYKYKIVNNSSKNEWLKMNVLIECNWYVLLESNKIILRAINILCTMVYLQLGQVHLNYHILRRILVLQWLCSWQSPQNNWTCLSRYQGKIAFQWLAAEYHKVELNIK